MVLPNKLGDKILATINNSASATYGYGRNNQDSAVSNVVTANLLEEFSLSGTKNVQNTSFRPGEILSYYITVTNTGTDSLYNVTISDNLGGTGTPLTFVDGSAYLNFNGVVSPIIPTSVNPLTFVVPTVMNAGDIATVDFLVRVNSAISNDVSEITNESTISANEGSATGPVLTLSPNPTVTILRDEYASVSITKSVSDANIAEGEPFSYTLELENSGNLPATGVVITDILPAGFVISSITSTTNGVTTTFSPADYTVDPTTNTLTLPTNPDVEITVPAFSEGGVGLTTVVINGQIN